LQSSEFYQIFAWIHSYWNSKMFRAVQLFRTKQCFKSHFSNL
jgi:hypothetical protein